jgi:hypothetical protein
MKITGNIRIPPEAEAALRAGNKIEAIKLIRQPMNVGLAESKAVLEAFAANPNSSAARHAVDAPGTQMKSAASPRATAPGYVRRVGLSPGEVPRENGALHAVMFIVAILAAIVAYIKFG